MDTITDILFSKTHPSPRMPLEVPIIEIERFIDNDNFLTFEPSHRTDADSHTFSSPGLKISYD